VGAAAVLEQAAGGRVERSKAYRMKTLRLRPQEDAIINEACSVLYGMERAALMTEASLFEAIRLGVGFSTASVPPFSGSWPYAPERGDEPTAVRITITFSLTVREHIRRAAEYLETSEPIFIIGSTLAYIGRLQRCFRTARLDTPRVAEAMRRKLEAIELPPQYQYRPRAKR
jgi:hypothetical protein